VAALTSVVQPQASFPADGSGRRVTATGRYDAAGQVLVTPRLLAGRRGYWVLTPLVVEPTGARLAVVRGFVTDPAEATAPAAGRVRVTGSLAPGESPPEAGTALPEGHLGSVHLADLVNRWGGTIYNAFVFATAEQPDVTAAAGPGIVRVPPPAPVGAGLSLRNAAYALQWWVFALFALYMWWRMVRDEHLREQSRQSPARPVPAPEREVSDV
jgi:cytochrome oxidase assembly protein ShyY1